MRMNRIVAALVLAAAALILWVHREPRPLYRVTAVVAGRAVLTAPGGWPPVRLVRREDLARTVRVGYRVRACEHPGVTYCVDHRASGLTQR